MRIHYRADPLKQDAWAAEQRAKGWGLGQWNLEMELHDAEAAGALWRAEWFEIPGFRRPPVNPSVLPSDIVKTVVAIDPSITDPGLAKDPNKDPDECGIGVAGLREDASLGVLADFSGVLAPSDWARVAVRAYSVFKASAIIYEANQGGDLVRDALRSIGPNVPLIAVHAAMGKRARAEPVAMLYEQGRASHYGHFPELEAEQTGWDSRIPSAPSPNRIDWLVWAAHGLGLCQVTGTRVRSFMKKPEAEED